MTERKFNLNDMIPFETVLAKHLADDPEFKRLWEESAPERAAFHEGVTAARDLVARGLAEGPENSQATSSAGSSSVGGPTTETSELRPGYVLRHHPQSACRGRACVVHNPSDHHMKKWPLLWRSDRGIMERTCAHGVGHPDPDSIAYRASTAYPDDGVHGCDGCCSATTSTTVRKPLRPRARVRRFFAGLKPSR